MIINAKHFRPRARRWFQVVSRQGTSFTNSHIRLLYHIYGADWYSFVHLRRPATFMVGETEALSIYNSRPHDYYTIILRNNKYFFLIYKKI